MTFDSLNDVRELLDAGDATDAELAAAREYASGVIGPRAEALVLEIDKVLAAATDSAAETSTTDTTATDDTGFLVTRYGEVIFDEVGSNNTTTITNSTTPMRMPDPDNVLDKLQEVNQLFVKDTEPVDAADLLATAS